MNRSDDNVTSNNKGPLSFRSLDEFLQWKPQDRANYRWQLPRQLQDQGYGVFVQDDWRIKPTSP